MFDDIAFDGGRLRPWHRHDAPRLVQAWSDTEIAAWNAVPAEPTLETATHWIAGQQERLEQRLAVDVVIDAAHPDGIMGEVGLSSFSDKHRAALIGYWLMPEARGLGLATAAVRAFAWWAHRTFELEVIIARCHEDNVGSQGVASRAGFVHEATDESGHQVWLSRTREK